MGDERQEPSAGPAGPPEVEGGEAPCLLDRVCPGCGRLATVAGAQVCERCGERLPSSQHPSDPSGQE
jgi:predicted amidophosphoribosyltransferase